MNNKGPGRGTQAPISQHDGRDGEGAAVDVVVVAVAVHIDGETAYGRLDGAPN